MKASPAPSRTATSSNSGRTSSSKGVLIAAWGVDAAEAYIYLRDEYPAARDILAREIAVIEKRGACSPQASSSFAAAPAPISAARNRR